MEEYEEEKGKRAILATGPSFFSEIVPSGAVSTAQSKRRLFLLDLCGR